MVFFIGELMIPAIGIFRNVGNLLVPGVSEQRAPCGDRRRFDIEHSFDFQTRGNGAPCLDSVDFIVIEIVGIPGSGGGPVFRDRSKGLVGQGIFSVEKIGENRLLVPA